MSDLMQSSSRPPAAVSAEVVVEPRVEDDILSLHRYLRLLLRRRWMILAVAATVFLLSVVQVFTTTPLYTSVASVQIDPEDPNILPYEEISSSSSSQRATRTYLATQIHNLQTRTVARRVVRRLDLAADPVFNAPTSGGLLKDRFWGTVGYFMGLLTPSAPPPPPAEAGAENPLSEEVAVGRVRGSLQVASVRNTRLLNVQYSSHDPAFATRVLGAVLEEFIEQHLEDKYESTVRASDFLHRQLRDLKIAVEKSEEAQIAYARASNIVNLNERETINRQKLADLSDELTRVEAELIAKTARYEAIREMRGGQFPEALADGTLRDLERRASELERQRAAYSQRYGSEWPEVKQTTLELEEVRRQLAAGRQQAIGRVKYEYDVTRGRLERLESALADQRTVVDRLNEDSIQHNILRREVETDKELYEGLLQRLKEAGVAAGLRSSNIRVVDDPTRPGGPSSPRKVRALLRALLLGLVLGVGAAFLLEMFDSTLKTTDDVTQHVGLAPLGLIPAFDGPDGRSRSRSAGKKRPRSLSHSDTTAQSRVLEAYRSLRTSILLSHSGQPPQAILVSSALPGEGKTTTVANTAIVLAQTGERTLMVDLDLRRPALGKVFRVRGRQGMSTFLSGNSDLSSQIRETEVPNLYLVTAGPPAPNPAELIGSQRMETGLKLLREYFTYVVIDSPPFLEITDALVASRWVDGVLLVAQGGRTPRDAVKKAGERLRYVGAKVLGVVLNNVDLRHSGYGYYRYSRYYDDYHQAALPAASSGPRQRA